VGFCKIFGFVTNGKGLTASSSKGKGLGFVILAEGFTSVIAYDRFTAHLVRKVVRGMKHPLLCSFKELFPGSGVMSRRAFNAVLTKGSLCPFEGKIVSNACHRTFSFMAA